MIYEKAYAKINLALEVKEKVNNLKEWEEFLIAFEKNIKEE